METGERVKDAFLEAAALGLDERNSFLSRLFARAPALHRRVERLLAAHRAAEAAARDACDRVGGVGAPQEQALPLRIGNYELVAQIAAGGSGVVYRARQVDLGRTVAVKLLRWGRLATEEELRRFRSEAEVAARLDHPSIVPVYEAGSIDGHPFLSMKLIDGPSLDSCIERYRDDPRAAARLVAHVARAVDQGHRRAVIHRDVKPSNVLIDEEGRPWIADFGTAKLLDGGQGRTVTGSLIGTPSYMAPEQAGARGEITTATDVHGLGCVLYELLVGRPPFVADSLAETLRLVREVDPEQVRSARPEIPRDLETICHTCLAKEPAQRYASALVLAEDLERWLALEPIHARRTTAIERLWLAARRRPLLSVLVAAVVLLAVTIVGGAVIAGHELRAGLERTRRAEHRTNEQRRGALLAEARFVRAGRLAGRRARALDLVRKAAAIRPGIDVVNEAIAALALPDLVTVRQWPRPAGLSWLRFDPGFDRYVAAFEDGRVELRNAADDRVLARLASAGPLARHPVFSRDGRYFAFTSYESGTWKDPRFEVWDLDRGEVLYAVDVLPDTSGGDFTPDGSEVVLSHGGRLFARNLRSGRERTILRLGKVKWSVRVRFDPAGKRLAVGGGEPGRLRILGASDEPIRELEGPRTAVTSLAWSPDGRRLAVGSHDFDAYVWDLGTGGPPTVLRGHAGQVPRVGFPFPDIVATGSWDGSTRFWDVTTGREVLRVKGMLEGNPNDSRFAIYTERTFSVAELARSDVLQVLNGHRGTGPRGVELDAAGRRAASGGDEEVRLWDLEAGVTTDSRPAAGLGRLLFHDGSLYVGLRAGLLRWKVEGGRFRGEPERVRAGFCEDVVSDAEGDLLAASMPNWIHLIRPRDEGRDLRIPRPEGATVLALSPDGTWLAAGGWRGRGAYVWRTENARVAAHLHPAEPVCEVHFSPDGRRLAIETRTGHHVHSVGSWRQERSFARRDGEGQGLAVRWSPDGRLLAAHSSRWQLGLFDAATGEEVASLTPPLRQEFNDLRFDRAGRRLVLATHRNRLLVWNLARLQSELAALGIDVPVGPSEEEAR